jgi:hypothetical protein
MKIGEQLRTPKGLHANRELEYFLHQPQLTGYYFGTKNIFMNNKDLDEHDKRNYTDTSKIVHRHLANKDDELTEEDLRNVRISTDLPPEHTITTGAEVASLTKKEEEEKPFERPATPWDVVD